MSTLTVRITFQDLVVSVITNVTSFYQLRSFFVVAETKFNGSEVVGSFEHIFDMDNIDSIEVF